jgi:hypothetical protein
MQSSGFESDLFEEDVSSDALVDSGDGFADGFEDAFGEDAFESAEAGDEFEEDSFEDDGFEEDSFEEDSFEEDSADEDALAAEGDVDALEEEDADLWAEEDAGDGFEEGFEDGFEGAAVEQAFADAADAEDEDEFIRRVWGRLRRAASPVLRRIRRRALPIGLRLLRQGARRIGGIAGQEIGTALGGGLSNVIGGLLRADAMDAFADIAADEAVSEDEMDEFVPVLAGMAGR